VSEESYPPVPSRLVSGGGGSEPTGTTEPYYPPLPGQGGMSGGGGRKPPTDVEPPTGPGFRRKDFIKAYANMVAQTWVDDSYLQLILANPVETLAAAGLPTAPGATIRPVQVKMTGTGQISDQVDAWVEGNRTGLYNLWLPIKPDDVDMAPGGGGADACVGGASCCCSPCCCCG
jgi:hypothetical protein